MSPMDACPAGPILPERLNWVKNGWDVDDAMDEGAGCVIKMINGGRVQKKSRDEVSRLAILTWE